MSLLRPRFDKFRLFPRGSWRGLSALALLWAVEIIEGTRGLSVRSEPRVVIWVVINGGCVVFWLWLEVRSRADSGSFISGFLGVIG